MARRTRNHRLPFPDPVEIARGVGHKQAYVDATCDFVAVRNFKIAGAIVSAGQPFDKSMVDARRLRQLYNQRLITLAPGASPATPARRPRAVGPTDLVHSDQARPPEKVARRTLSRRAA